MTRNKPGQIAPKGDSAKVPIQEATPETQDGPEGYFEGGSIRQSEIDKTGASEHHTEKKYLESGEKTLPNPSRTIEKDLAVKSPRFGSPLAYSSYQYKPDFFKGLLPESTRVLFDQVVAEASALRGRLLEGVALTNDGSNGHFCRLRTGASPSMNLGSSTSDSDNSKLDLYCFELDDNRLELPLFVNSTSTVIHRTYVARDDPVDAIDLRDSSSMTSETSKADKTVDVRRVHDSQTGEIEYFVVNTGLDSLSVNGTDVDPLVRAGPLPEFAVLEMRHLSIFWWRTATALDYIPSLKRKRDSEDSGEESPSKALKSDTDSLPDLQVFSDSNDWCHEYRRRLQLCKERPIDFTPSITSPHPPHQIPRGEMHDSDVILAIGAVWLGLVNAKTDFAYANSILFSTGRSMRMVGMRAVKGNNPFVMPLILNAELQGLSPESEEDAEEPLEPVFSAFQRGEEEKNQENFAAAEKAKQKDPGNKNKAPLPLKDQEIQNQNHKGGIGHFVLAIAEMVDRNEYNTEKASVRLRFMDSAPQITRQAVVRRVARNIVRNSGWLGDIWPYFDADEEHWMRVIKQSGNRCGEHTVLNAWAYMLGIPPAATRNRALGRLPYDQIRELISLALLGQLDSLTIRAWMQCSEYAVHSPLSQLQKQIQTPDLPNDFPNIQTVALNEDNFNETVDYIRTQEQATNKSSPLPPGSVTAHGSEHATQDPVASPSGSSGTPGSSATPAQIPSMPQPSFPTQETWQQRLEVGLKSNEALRACNPRKTTDRRKDATNIKGPSNMSDFEVVLGIAPVWEGLKRRGRVNYDFTYAGMDVLSPGGEQTGRGAIGTWTRFIMPLFLSSVDDEAREDEREGEKKIQSAGHVVLCVAELVDMRPKTVQLEILDSRVGTVSVADIMSKAKTIISQSGWLANFGPRTEPVYRTPIQKQVPRQVGVNTGGLYVIFNAWATMLGIPIHPHELRRGRSEEDEGDAIDEAFLETGLQIINLALEGFMNSTTIQAFFNVFGYSVEQCFGDPVRAVIPVNAIGMNQEKFCLTLEQRYWSDIFARARRIKFKFPDKDMNYLVEYGLDKDQAWKALLMVAGGDGDPARALEWHFDQNPPGMLPKPEDALSPKTPDRSGWPDP